MRGKKAEFRTHRQADCCNVSFAGKGQVKQDDNILLNSMKFEQPNDRFHRYISRGGDLKTFAVPFDIT